MDENIP